MEKIIVKGGTTLSGEVNISVAKNSVLPIIVASILNPNDIVIKETPFLEDVEVLTNLLYDSKVQVEKINNNRDLKLNTTNVDPIHLNGELIRKMRASFLVMGPLLSRFGVCKISMPGGCNIGSRPVDLHLKGFKLLGAEISIDHGNIEAKAKKLKGNRIYLDFPSVGATENLIMAATLAKGTTIIENAAMEPEIWDLINFLNKMGANISEDYKNQIIIDGVDELKGIEYMPIYDRVEAATFMVAAAITKSKIKINGINEEHLRPNIEKLKECGVKIDIFDNSMIVDGRCDLKPVDIKTMPFPGFPTDTQSQMMTLLTLVKGTSVITETVFENRFMHVSELQRMGAKIKIDGRTAIIEGVDSLTGCEVKATDLRAGASMILAGLVAKGQTEVKDIYHIDRGYVDIENKFINLGADVSRIITE